MSAQPATVPGWRYRVDAGDRAAGGPALLMLHGTGGAEQEMLALGRSLAPGAPLIAPRGRVSEHGMARFFSRSPADPFLFPDLAERTDELAAFARDALAAHDLAGRSLVAVGYSNGANAAVSLMLRHPGLLAGGALLRPLLPSAPPAGLDLTGTRVLVAGGRVDQIIPEPMVRELVQALQGAGADVTEYWSDVGHGLTNTDLAAAAEFIGGSWRS